MAQFKTQKFTFFASNTVIFYEKRKIRQNIILWTRFLQRTLNAKKHESNNIKSLFFHIFVASMIKRAIFANKMILTQPIKPFWKCSHSSLVPKP